MTERQRAILDAVLDDDPGDMCAGCGNTDVDDWRLARKGAWLTHGIGISLRCRFPCDVEKGADPCEHVDCVDVRRRLIRTMPRMADPTQASMSSSSPSTVLDVVAAVQAISQKCQ